MNNLNIHIVGTGSSGNCVIVDDGYGKLMLDAGLRPSQIVRGADLSNIEAVLITHEHGDHCKAVPELQRRGLDVYMSNGTYVNFPVDLVLNRPNLIKGFKQFKTDSWIVMPFDVEHDVEEPLGFLCESRNSGTKFVYIVDSFIVDYDFTGVTHWLVECNYSDDLLERGNYEEFVKERVRRSHLSLDSLKALLTTSDLSKTEEIWLLHMSDANSDEARFISEIQAVTGIPVYTQFAPRKKPTTYVTYRG